MTLRGIREGQSLHHRRRTTGNNSLVEKPRPQEIPGMIIIPENMPISGMG
jgi:hypothetical protein